MGQISDNDMLRLAFSETAKLVPYVTGSRKTVKVYLKTCLDYWATAEDSVRISAFLSVRRLAAATDESILDNVLKVCAFLSRVTKKNVSNITAEHIPDVSPVMQVHERTHITLYHPHEELGEDRKSVV